MDFLLGKFYGIWYASEEIVKPPDVPETLKTRAT
jgi:hypothetical protein